MRQVASRLRLPFLGLVLGSIAPDLPYYIGRFDIASFAHTVTGALFVGVPLSVLLALVLSRWQAVLAAPMPQPHRSAVQSLQPPALDSIPALAMFAAAAFAGALTHVVWDAFTHASGQAVRAFPLLRTEAVAIGGRTFYLYNVLQHLSTALGLLVLVLAYRRWLRTVPAAAAQESRWTRYWLLGASALASLALGTCVTLVMPRAALSLSGLVVQSVISATAIFALAYVVLGLYLRTRGK